MDYLFYGPATAKRRKTLYLVRRLHNEASARSALQEHFNLDARANDQRLIPQVAAYEVLVAGTDLILGGMTYLDYSVIEVT